MKAYLLTTGGLFGLMAALHVYVVIAHWQTLAADPWPVVVLALCGALSVWAWRLVRALSVS